MYVTINLTAEGIQYDLFSGFLSGLSEAKESPVDFNEKLFHKLVDYAVVYSDGRVVFTFRNGAEVGTEIWKKTVGRFQEFLDFLSAIFVNEKRLKDMEICIGLRYNLNVGSDR